MSFLQGVGLERGSQLAGLPSPAGCPEKGSGGGLPKEGLEHCRWLCGFLCAYPNGSQASLPIGPRSPLDMDMGRQRSLGPSPGLP